MTAASDIHFERRLENFHIPVSAWTVLSREIAVLPSVLAPRVVAAVKVLSGMEIADTGCHRMAASAPPSAISASISEARRIRLFTARKRYCGCSIAAVSACSSTTPAWGASHFKRCAS